MFGVDNKASASSTILSEKLIVFQLMNKSFECYGTPSFATVLTTACQCTVS